MMRIVVILALIAIFSGCANNPPFGAFRAGLTSELVATVDNELLYVGVEGLKTESTVQPTEKLGDVIIWRTLDNTSEIATQNGLIVATRSLGDDLMSADVSNSVAALQARDLGTYYPRFHTFLDGEYQTQFRSFQCIIDSRVPERLNILNQTHNAIRIEEVCTFPGQTVTNSYWLGPDGTVLRSRQWVGETVQYIQTERLK